MRYKLYAVIALALLGSGDIFSQFILYRRDSVSIPEYRLDDVNVRATRETHKVRELPASVSMIGKVTLERQQAASLKDVTGLVPNFFMPEYGSKLTSPVYIRGIGSRINSPSVGLYVDNAPYFEKSSFDFDFFEIERVEVLRGPQGTLYGRNTMGGIINVYTRSPFREQGTRAGVSMGTYGHIRANVTSYFKPGRKAAFSLSGGVNHRDGFFVNSYTSEAADMMNSYSGRMRAEYYLTDALKAELVVNYENSRQGGYPYMVYHDTMSVTDVNYDSFSYYNRNMLANSLVLKYELPSVLVTSSTSWHYFNDFQAIDQDFTPASLFFVTQGQASHTLSNEIIVKPVREGRYRWVTGAFVFNQTMYRDVNLAYGDDGVVRYGLPGPASTLKTYDNPTSGAAVFHQSTLSGIFTEGLYLTAGMRLDYEKSGLGYEYFRTIMNNTTQLGEFVSDLKFFEVMPRFALGYSVNERQSFYLTASRGYKTGGFNSTFEREEDRTFMPESSWNYEAGFKVSSRSNRFHGDFSLFFIDWKNQQIYQTVPSGQGSMLKNAGRSVSRGAEASITGLLPLNTEYSFSYGLTEALFRDHKVNATTDYSGNRVPFVPATTIFAAVSKPIVLNRGFIERITFNLNYSGTGRIYWSESNSTYQPYYGTLGGFVSFSLDKVSLELWGKNLTNTSYHAFRFDALGNSYVQKGRPLWIGLNLKVTI